MESNLNEDDLVEFRKEYQNLEKDATTYIGLYLSALLVAVGYVAGKEARPLQEMVLGNAKYNLYGLFAVGWGNLVFGSMLAYKSLVVQEINQFIYANSKTGNVYRRWEAWRSGPESVARPMRLPYYGMLLSVPVGVQSLLLFGLWRALRSNNSFPPLGISALSWFWILVVCTLIIGFRFIIQNTVIARRHWNRLRSKADRK